MKRNSPIHSQNLFTRAVFGTLGNIDELIITRKPIRGVRAVGLRISALAADRPKHAQYAGRSD